MTNRRSKHARSRNRHSSHSFENQWIVALVLGIFMLIVSLLPISNPILKMVAQVIQIPALLAIGVSVLLLISKNGKTEFQPSIELTFTAQPSEHTTKPQAEPPSEWNRDVLSAIEWRRFEALIEKLFTQEGYKTRSQSHGADGGVDIWLHSKNVDGPVAIVQCKHWQGKTVGVREVREFLGVMASYNLKRGIYATSSTFTADALAFAKANGISIQDGNGLLRTIRNRTPEQQAELLKVATEGEYWRPTCASCGVKMTHRQPKNGGKPFWGCHNYPKCRSTLPMKNEVT